MMDEVKRNSKIMIEEIRGDLLTSNKNVEARILEN